jgi:MerR family transcriptional regulator, copper efflux regulator
MRSERGGTERAFVVPFDRSIMLSWDTIHSRSFCRRQKRKLMNIGRASKASGVSAKMIRYYERIGLLPEPDRRHSGYREYTAPDIHRLQFVRRARDLGFSMQQIRELLSLWADSGRSAAEIRALAKAHLTDMEKQVRKLTEIIDTLNHLINACKKGDRPHCPIIVELGSGIIEAPASRRR